MPPKIEPVEFVLPHPLHPKQEQFFLAALSGKHRIVAYVAGRQAGKSARAGTLVTTYYGPKPIEEVLTGDLVYSLDVKTHRVVLRSVLEVIDRGVIKPGIQIDTYGGRSITVSQEHPFYTPKGWEICWLLHNDDLIAVPNEAMNRLAWDRIKLMTIVPGGQMYDLAVEETENFIANDIFVHNSTVGAITLATMVLSNWAKPYAAYIAAAPNYKTMQGGMMQSFLKVVEPLRLGTYNKQDKEYTFKNKHKIYFRSLDSDRALEGLTDVYGAWADEAGQYAHAGWMHLQARCSPNQAPMLITTTPYGLGWLYTDVFLPYNRDDRMILIEGGEEVEYKARDYIFMVQGWSNENPAFRENMALQRRRLGDQEFERLYAGTFQQMQGLVYPDFTPQTHIIPVADWEKVFYKKAPQLPLGWKVTAGVDWGSSNEGDPFAVAVIVYGPDGRSYQVDEVLRHGMSATDMLNILQELQKMWGIQMFYCDTNYPLIIEDMNRKGMQAKGTDKSAGVSYGIAQHHSIIRTKRRQIFSNCEFTIASYQTYAYKKITSPERAPHAKPSHLMSDLMDAIRYDTIGNPSSYAIMEVKAPFVPSKSEDSTKSETVTIDQVGDPKWRIQRVKAGNRKPGGQW